MNPSTAQARVVVDELIRGGVRDVVLCPGSRNAPLAFALHDADRAGRLRLHVRIDERTAGFLAIGLAVAERAPVCVAMTSGTAVANLGPAVVEANYARVPLIVLSANRPYELLGTGANQTFEQLGYFGTQVRATISLGLGPRIAPDRASTRSTRSGGRRPAGFWWPPRVLARPTPDRCSSTSRCASRWCPTPTKARTGRPIRAAGPARRQAVDLHAAGHVRPAARHRPDPRHRRHRRSRRRRAPEPGRICRPSPSRPHRRRRTRCTRWRCGWCGRSRSSCWAARRCTGRCRRCWPIRRSRCTR